MVSDLGQGAAAYAARSNRLRRPSRLSNTLSGLAQVGERSSFDHDMSDRRESPKRWVRDVPGTVNDLGEVVRPGSPLRLSSSSRTAMLAGSSRRRSLRIPKNVLYYGLLFFPIVASIPLMLSYFRNVGKGSPAPEIPTSVLESGEINPALLEFLKENSQHVARLSARVDELERIRAENADTIAALRSQISEQASAQAKIVNEVKGVTTHHVQQGGVSQSDLDKIRLELENAKAELSLGILEQKSELQELASKKQNSRSSDNVEKLIERALYRHLADGTEMVDYALESTGGSIVSVSGTHTGSVGLIGLATSYLLASRKSEEMIRPQVTPGQCWPMTGQSGWAVIALSDLIIPTAISLEHVPPEIAPHFESAPQDFSLSAVNGTGEFANLIPLGTWKYRKPVPGEMPVIQTFTIPKTFDFPTSAVNFTINSNYGGDYTCIYRVRVHGKRQS